MDDHEAHVSNTIQIPMGFEGGASLDFQMHLDAHDLRWQTKQSHDACCSDRTCASWAPAMMPSRLLLALVSLLGLGAVVIGKM